MKRASWDAPRRRPCDGCPVSARQSRWASDLLTGRAIRRALVWGVAAFILTVLLPSSMATGLLITVIASAAGALTWKRPR